MGKRSHRTSRGCRRSCRPCAPVSIVVATGPNRCAACTSPSLTVANARSGIPALEDKIVQGAVAEVLSAIYEVDFMGSSYGFRPGRHPHQALRALHTAFMTQYVNWVLDADIRRFFDSVNHEWLLRMLAHRVADPRILELIRGLAAGWRA